MQTARMMRERVAGLLTIAPCAMLAVILEDRPRACATSLTG